MKPTRMRCFILVLSLVLLQFSISGKAVLGEETADSVYRKITNPSLKTDVLKSTVGDGSRTVAQDLIDTIENSREAWETLPAQKQTNIRNVWRRAYAIPINNAMASGDLSGALDLFERGLQSQAFKFSSEIPFTSMGFSSQDALVFNDFVKLAYSRPDDAMGGCFDSGTLSSAFKNVICWLNGKNQPEAALTLAQEFVERNPTECKTAAYAYATVINLLTSLGKTQEAKAMYDLWADFVRKNKLDDQYVYHKFTIYLQTGAAEFVEAYKTELAIAAISPTGKPSEPAQTDEPEALSEKPREEGGPSETSSESQKSVSTDEIRNATSFEAALALFPLDPSEANLEALIGAWVAEADGSEARNRLSSIREAVRKNQNDPVLRSALVGRCWEIEAMILRAEKKFKAAAEAYRLASAEFQEAGDLAKAAVMDSKADSCESSASAVASSGKTGEETPTPTEEPSTPSPEAPSSSSDSRIDTTRDTSVPSGNRGSVLVQIEISIPGMGRISIATSGAVSIRIAIGGGGVRIALTSGSASGIDEGLSTSRKPERTGGVRVDRLGSRGQIIRSKNLRNGDSATFSSGSSSETTIRGRNVDPQEESGKESKGAFDFIGN